MPIYTYKCDNCGQEMGRRRSVEDRNVPEKCFCGYPASRYFEPGAVQIQVPEHFRHLQGDFLPGAGDTEAWDARQGTGSTSHAPRQQTLKEAFDEVKQWT